MRMNSFHSFLCKLLLVFALALICLPIQEINSDTSQHQGTILKMKTSEISIPLSHTQHNQAIPTTVSIVIVISLLIYLLVRVCFIFLRQESDIYKLLLRQWLEPNKYRSTYVAKRTLHLN